VGDWRAAELEFRCWPLVYFGSEPAGSEVVEVSQTLLHSLRFACDVGGELLCWVEMMERWSSPWFTTFRGGVDPSSYIGEYHFTGRTTTDCRRDPDEVIFTLLLRDSNPELSV